MSVWFRIDSVEEIMRSHNGHPMIYLVATPKVDVFQTGREYPACHECARSAFVYGDTIRVGFFEEGDPFECDCGNAVESYYGPG